MEYMELQRQQNAHKYVAINNIRSVYNEIR